MSHDVLPIKLPSPESSDIYSTYTYTFSSQSGAPEEKESALNDQTDKVWESIRHMHMKEALDKLIEDFKSYAGEYGTQTSGKSLNDMKDLLASLPKLKDTKDQLSLHLSMAEKCMEIFESHKLPLIAGVEQVSKHSLFSERFT
jgi:syntaxin-binding protein 1